MAESGKEVRILRGKRGALRGHSKRYLEKAKELLDLGEEADMEQVGTVQDKLADYQEKLESLDNQIFPFCSDAELDNEIAECARWQADLTDSVIDLANRKLTLQKEKDESMLSAAANMSDKESVCGSVCAQRGGGKTSAKLPKLSMAKFDGQPLKWREFWDSFESAIHQNQSLSSVDKFNYLKGLLEGDAERAIRGIAITNANYNIAIETVRERFGNEQTVVFAHFDCLFRLSACSKETMKLRQTYDECERHIRGLEAMGITEDRFGVVFVPLILSKLPEDIRVNLNRLNGCKPWELCNLRRLLKEEIVARELGETSNPQAAKPNSSQSNFSSRGKPPHLATSEALVMDARGKRSPKCVFCDGTHYSDECSKFPDFESRRVKVKDRCFACLRHGHLIAACPRPSVCVYCKRKHHRSLCQAKFGWNKSTGEKPTTSSLNVNAEEYTPTHAMMSPGEHVLMQTATTEVQNCISGQKSAVRILFDTGSQRSFITSELVKSLGLKIDGYETMWIATFGAEKSRMQKLPTVKLHIRLIDGTYKEISANSVPFITSPVRRIAMNLRKYEILSELPLADSIATTTETTVIDLLIGNDYYFDFVAQERINLSESLVLVRSKLGWILSGRVNAPGRESASVALLSLDTSTMTSCLDRTWFWSLDAIGIHDPANTTDDDVAVQKFNKTVQFEDGRYAVTWPWKDEVPDLPENYELAFGRLKSLLRRLDKMPEVVKKYDDTIAEQVKLGIVEEVTPETVQGPKKHYLPHHCVITSTKATTKLRVVYDASAKTRKDHKSLNECMYRGPVLLKNLCGLLLRARLSPILILSDIEKAFLQVGLQTPERDVTRFLWLKDCNQLKAEENLRILRFCRVPFGVIASPFLLGATIAHHLKADGGRVATEILDNIYVDNVFGFKDTEEEAYQFYLEAKALFQKAAMNLREWLSNSSTFIAKLPEKDKAQGAIVKVLGVNWNIELDTLAIPFLINGSTAKTKRGILHTISTIFDPLGYVSPVTVKANILIQRMWKNKLDWDQELPSELLEEWNILTPSLQGIDKIQLERHVGRISTCSPKEVELHCFCDASASAYAACVYLRVGAADNARTNLMFCKSRLAPLKEVSIPRLELMAAVIGVRALSFVAKETSMSSCRQVLWSDSKCVLHWIQSRAKSRTTLQVSPLWWNGPTWLSGPEGRWPKNIDDNRPVDKENAIVEVVNLAKNEPTEPESLIMNLNKYSSLKKLLRVTSWVLRFIDKIRKFPPEEGVLKLFELRRSRLHWDTNVQRCHFSAEFSAIEKNKRNNHISQFGLFIDENGLLRCRGRIKYSDLPDAAKFPKLLPKVSHYTDLILDDCHRRIGHAGPRHILALVRQEYWIPQARRQVQRVVRACNVCKRWDGGPYRPPSPPALPQARVEEGSPFTCTGLDYFGPLFIRENVESDTTYQKLWVSLFTCAVTRAVHLEVVMDMTSEQFLLGFRRFVSRRGKPKIVISDNAKQFKLAKSAIDKLWGSVLSSPSVGNYLSHEGIDWTFIPEFAPWMGGFYERLVGTVKRSLKKMLGTRCLDFIQLVTLMTEIEGIVNSRPLGYVDNGPEPYIVLT